MSDICLLHTDNANLPPIFLSSRRLNSVPLPSCVICACSPQAVYSRDQSLFLLFTSKCLTRGLSWCVVPRIVCSLSVLMVEQVGGTPGSGKSTLLSMLQEHVRNADIRNAIVLAIWSWKPKEESRSYYVRSMCTSS